MTMHDQAAEQIHALAGGFADPADAAVFLNPADYDGDGGVDTDAIKADLAGLLERKPHLAAPRASLAQQIASAQAAGNIAESIRLKNIQVHQPKDK